MNTLNEMRLVAAIILIILGLVEPVAAQEADSLLIINKSGVIPREIGRHLHTGFENRPVLFPDFSGLDTHFQRLPVMNFQSQSKWKIDWRSSFLHGMPLWNIYQGNYGIRTYKATDKIYIGTIGYSDRNFSLHSGNRGVYPQTNYSSSLFVGYKFSEKFSISAGFTIQSYDDPIGRNH